MNHPVLFAYRGDLDTAPAIAWLAETCGTDVVTLTLDVGQGVDLQEARARALAAGALRAHVLDAREPFVRDALLPALKGQSDIALDTLVSGLVARALVEIAAIEQATLVAHASGRRVIDTAIAALAPALTVVSAVGARLASTGLVDTGTARHATIAGAARLDIGFEAGTPVAVNDVALPLVDLVECVAVIAERHGLVGRGAWYAPAAIVLRAAYAALPAAGAGLIGLELANGELSLCPPRALVGAAAPTSTLSLVHHA